MGYCRFAHGNQPRRAVRKGLVTQFFISDKWRDRPFAKLIPDESILRRTLRTLHPRFYMHQVPSYINVHGAPNHKPKLYHCNLRKKRKVKMLTIKSKLMEKYWSGIP